MARFVGRSPSPPKGKAEPAIKASAPAADAEFQNMSNASLPAAAVAQGVQNASQHELMNASSKTLGRAQSQQMTFGGTAPRFASRAGAIAPAGSSSNYVAADASTIKSQRNSNIRDRLQEDFQSPIPMSWFRNRINNQTWSDTESRLSSTGTTQHESDSRSIGSVRSSVVESHASSVFENHMSSLQIQLLYQDQGSGLHFQRLVVDPSQTVAHVIEYICKELKQHNPTEWTLYNKSANEILAPHAILNSYGLEVDVQLTLQAKGASAFNNEPPQNTTRVVDRLAFEQVEEAKKEFITHLKSKTIYLTLLLANKKDKLLLDSNGLPPIVAVVAEENYAVAEFDEDSDDFAFFVALISELEHSTNTDDPYDSSGVECNLQHAKLPPINSSFTAEALKDRADHVGSTQGASRRFRRELFRSLALFAEATPLTHIGIPVPIIAPLPALDSKMLVVLEQVDNEANLSFEKGLTADNRYHWHHRSKMNSKFKITDCPIWEIYPKFYKHCVSVLNAGIYLACFHAISKVGQIDMFVQKHFPNLIPCHLVRTEPSYLTQNDLNEILALKTSGFNAGNASPLQRSLFNAKEKLQQWSHIPLNFEELSPLGAVSVSKNVIYIVFVKPMQLATGSSALNYNPNCIAPMPIAVFDIIHQHAYNENQNWQYRKTVMRLQRAIDELSTKAIEPRRRGDTNASTTSALAAAAATELDASSKGNPTAGGANVQLLELLNAMKDIRNKWKTDNWILQLTSLGSTMS